MGPDCTEDEASSVTSEQIHRKIRNLELEICGLPGEIKVFPNRDSFQIGKLRKAGVR
jgi:hypothetical protein